MEENMVMNEAITETVQEPAYDSTNMLTEMKKTAAKIGWKYAVFSVAVICLQYLYAILLPERFAYESWATFLQIIIPMHILGFGLLLLLTSKMPKAQLEKKKLGFGKFILCVFIGAGICAVGMVIGLIFHFALTLPFGVNANDSSALGELMLSSDAFWRILTVGISAPIVEELIFRKLIVDRMAKYGEFVAIIMSGLMFGIFHGNFQQAFFATGLGMFWAFIYLKTGKIWYTIAMHMTINLTTSVITVYLAQWALQYLEYSQDPNFAIDLMNGEMNAIMAGVSSMVLLAWECFLGLVALTGIILFFVNLKKFKLNPNPYGFTKGQMFTKGVFNWGMILFWLACAFLFVTSYGSMILSAVM